MKTHINDTKMFKFLKLHFDATTALRLAVIYNRALINDK